MLCLPTLGLRDGCDVSLVLRWLAFDVRWPAICVRVFAAEDDGEAIEDNIERLTKELFAAFDESSRLEQLIRLQMERIHV